MIEIDVPLPDCQHDAFLLIRVKGCNIDRPQWQNFLDNINKPDNKREAMSAYNHRYGFSFLIIALLAFFDKEKSSSRKSRRK